MLYISMYLMINDWTIGVYQRIVKALYTGPGAKDTRRFNTVIRHSVISANMIEGSHRAAARVVTTDMR